jgi:hypothetical protein
MKNVAMNHVLTWSSTSAKAPYGIVPETLLYPLLSLSVGVRTYALNPSQKRSLEVGASVLTETCFKKRALAHEESLLSSVA